MIVVAYAVPGFLFAIFLIVFFAGGTFFDWFPLRGLTSDNWAQLSWPERIVDYFWHLALPLIAMALAAFATTTLLTKNSFLDEIRKQYVVTARSKGLTERQVLYGHVFRNAMLLVISGFPGAFISRLLRRLAADRDDLLARRARAARLRERDEPRLSGGLRHALHLLADGPRRAAHLRPDLYLDRSAHRFREPRGLSGWTQKAPPDAPTPGTTARSRRSCRCPARRCRRRSARASTLSPINRRRWRNFKANGRGYWSLWIFLVLFVLSLFAEFIANDRPILVSYKGEMLFPVLVDYPEEKFGGFLAVTDYRSPFVQDEIEANGWILWPPIRYSYRTINSEIPEPAPAHPSWMLDKETRCSRYAEGVNDKNCTAWNWNWLGTDDQARDVLARLIYGFRLSVLFGFALTILSSVVGVAAGAVQGYFGGRVDLFFQRFIEIWTAIPSLYLLLIISSVLVPGFFVLLGILLLFSWVALVGVVRAEFLRARNFEYVKAARALGVGNLTIMFRHLLPNAMVGTLTFMPFILNGSITTLTSLDFLGLGMPPGSPSLGELLAQGKNNLQAPWLGITGFIVISLMLSLLIFVGEAVRDAFDPRKTFRVRHARMD